MEYSVSETRLRLWTWRKVADEQPRAQGDLSHCTDHGQFRISCDTLVSQPSRLFSLIVGVRGSQRPTFRSSLGQAHSTVIEVNIELSCRRHVRRCADGRCHIVTVQLSRPGTSPNTLLKGMSRMQIPSTINHKLRRQYRS